MHAHLGAGIEPTGCNSLFEGCVRPTLFGSAGHSPQGFGIIFRENTNYILVSAVHSCMIFFISWEVLDE